MGLTLDEFALWLNLRDVYWKSEGRRSIDAVIIAVCVTGFVLVGFTAWLDVGKGVEDGVYAVVGFFGGFAIVLAIINAAKEKFGMAIWALLIPPVGLVGAIRRGRPHSLWARYLYRSEKRREKAAERFEGRESPWFWKNPRRRKRRRRKAAAATP